MRAYQPLADHVLVRRRDKKISAGGLHLPDRRDKDDHEPIEAEVLAVGPGRFVDFKTTTPPMLHDQARVQPMPVEPGQVVLVRRYSGFSLEDELIMVSIDEIVAIVVDNEGGAS